MTRYTNIKNCIAAAIEYIKKCAWCDRHFENGKWQNTNMQTVNGHLTTTHGICPSCYLKVIDDIRETKQQQSDVEYTK